MNKTLKWVLIGVGVLLALLVGLQKAGVFGKDEGLKVTAEKAATRTIIETVNASGKVYPEIEVKVTPEISGTITDLTIREGDTVKRGQVLARIYAEQYNIQRSQAASGVAQSQAQVANAEAQLGSLKATLEQARQTYEMQRQLYNDKVISRNEFNVAEANYKSAQASYNAAVAGIKGTKANVSSARASLQRANTDLRRTTIVAPMDGVVSLLNIKKGEGVAGNTFNVGTEILRIADMNSIEVRVDVGENDIPKVKLGDSADITIEAYTDRKFKGIVTQIASSNNGASVSSLASAATGDVTQYRVYIRILRSSYEDLLGKGSFPFRPGMTANADIQTRRVINALSVPVNAVTTRDKPDSIRNAGGKDANEPDIIVFVKNKENKVSPVKVTTGIQDMYYIEILSGLKKEDEVISGPYEVVNKTLNKDSKVKVVDKKDLYEVKKD